jgi:hypothetical protein
MAYLNWSPLSSSAVRGCVLLMWSASSITALIVAAAGLVTAVGALIHSVQTRQAAAAIGAKVTRMTPPGSR